MDEFSVSFPGGKKVEIHYQDWNVMTDQAVEDGGDGVAPSPYDLFMGSLTACAGIVALSFCRKRELPTEGLKVRLQPDYSEEEHRTVKVTITVELPVGFPEKYKGALSKAVDTCAVKRALANPPEFETVIL